MTELRAPDSDLSGHELLDALFTPGDDNRWARDAVADYFHSGRFSGRRFERLAAADSDWFEPVDLVAVSMLGVDVGGDAALAILEDEAEHLAGHLAQIPSEALHEASWSVLEPGSQADLLWHDLRSIDGLGPTKVGKLLARKRPHLIPVFDERVHRRMGSPAGWWRFHWDWWHDSAHVDAVRQLRAAVGGIDDISLLRVWDVAVWRYDVAKLPRVRGLAPGGE